MIENVFMGSFFILKITLAIIRKLCAVLKPAQWRNMKPRRTQEHTKKYRGSQKYSLFFLFINNCLINRQVCDTNDITAAIICFTQREREREGQEEAILLLFFIRKVGLKLFLGVTMCQDLLTLRF